MRTVYFSLGSNLSNKKLNIKTAIQLLEFHFSTTVQSASIYETKPWGFKTENTFLNTCVKIELAINANEILKTTQLIEVKMGRAKSINKNTYTSRIIDIDILYIGNEVHNTSQLIVPHPLLYNRNFVLIPLLELAPNFNDPISNKTISELIEDCPDIDYPTKIS